MSAKKYIKAIALACSMGLMLPILGTLGFGTAAGDNQDDAPVLVLEAEQGKLDGNASASGTKVGNIGKNGGTVEGKVTFDDLAIPADGEYRLQLHYFSGSDDRYFNLTTDFGKYKLDCPSTGSFSKVGTIEINVDLKAGGSLTVGSDWYGPDLDKIEVFETEQAVFPDRDYTDADTVTWEDVMTIDLHNGTYSVLSGGKIILQNAHAEVDLDGTVVSSDDFAKHSYTEDKEGGTLTFTHTDHPTFGGTMTQKFYQKDGYLLTEVLITGAVGESVSTNRITPLAVYQKSVGVENGVFVQIPFDNDMWVEPAFIGVKSLQQVTGYEVAAYYNADTSAGLVIGSVAHDTWKTGITMQAQRGEVMSLALYGGAADTLTRDNSPHGVVTGETVSSPLTFIGYFADWREGFTAYGKANAAVVPPKESVQDVPFGFNSWGTLQSSVTYSDMIAVSDYIEKYLQDTWSEDGAAIYINIDSYWDFITANDPNCKLDLQAALRSFVLHCRKNGQKAGIYFTPFACWHKNESELKSSRMDGSSYTYYDAAIKKTDGTGLYGTLDGGYALDPTHPGTIARIENQLNFFIELGFEYIKLDFMTHGAVEGQHYDSSVTTGMQAYNYGMAKIAEICAGKMYVNLSIAPLFPYQYADGRRISCDAFSSLDNTMHVLSHLTACFWEDQLYPYPDPDHLVVTGVSEGVARCRVTAGAISGTSFLIGDDLAKIKEGSANHKRILKMFGNADVVSVAKLGRTFTPYAVNAGDRCANAYWCELDGVLYLAVFNFDVKKADMTFDLSTVIDTLESDAVAKELWSGELAELNGMKLSLSLKGQDAALFRIGSPAKTDTSDNTPDDNKAPADDGDKGQLPLIIGAAAAAVAVIAAAAITASVLVRKRKKGHK